MLRLADLVKDKSTLDITRICSAWSWLLHAQEDVLHVSLAGDLFFIGQNDEINWLETGTGNLIRVADSEKEFNELCLEEENLNRWFLASLIDDLIDSGLVPLDGEVYSYYLMPQMGGEYSLENIRCLDLYQHFELTGIISEQTKDLPDALMPSSNTEEEEQA
jgi:hypothetical protein